MPLEVHRTPEGAVVLVDGKVRATFVGDLDDPPQAAAFNELLNELFPTTDVPNFEGKLTK